MSNDAIYRYFGKNPSYVGGDDDHDKVQKRGGTISVMPCGVVVFSGSFTPEFANYVGFIGSFDNELADAVADLEYDDDYDDVTDDVNSTDITEINTTDIVNSGGIMVFGAYADDDASDASDDNGTKHNIIHEYTPFDITNVIAI